MTQINTSPSAAEAQNPARRFTPLQETVFVGGLIAVIYLLTLSGNHVPTEDSMRYAADVQSGQFHLLTLPYHLLNGWYGWLAWRIATVLGYGGGPLIPMMVANAIMGAVGIAVLWHALRRRFESVLVPLVAGGLLASSFGYWRYSTEVEVQAGTLLSAILTLVAAVRAAEVPSVRRFVVLGAVNGVAILAHDTNVLLATMAGAALVGVVRQDGWKPALKRAGAYVGVGSAVVIPPYLVAAIVVHVSSWSEFVDWMTHYAQVGQWGKPGLHSISHSVQGSVRSLVDVHFGIALRPQSATTPVEQLLITGISKPIALLAVAFAALFGLSALGVVRRFVSTARSNRTPAANLVGLMALCWFTPRFVMGVYWDPINPEAWLQVWAPVCILAGLGFSGAFHRLDKPVAIVAVSSLFLVNLVGNILPLANDNKDLYDKRVAWFEENTRPNDLVLSHGYQWTHYLRYYSDGRVTETGNSISTDLDQLRLDLEALRDKFDSERVLVSITHDPNQDESGCYGIPSSECGSGPGLEDRLQAIGARQIATAHDSEVWEVPAERNDS